jgi:hypothetical protein
VLVPTGEQGSLAVGPACRQLANRTTAGLAGSWRSCLRTTHGAAPPGRTVLAIATREKPPQSRRRRWRGWRSQSDKRGHAPRTAHHGCSPRGAGSGGGRHCLRGKGAASWSTMPAIALRALRSRGRSSPDARCEDRGTGRFGGEAVARGITAGTTDPACASPGRSSRPPAVAAQLRPWQGSRRPSRRRTIVVLPIRSREDRASAGAEAIVRGTPPRESAEGSPARMRVPCSAPRARSVSVC